MTSHVECNARRHPVVAGLQQPSTDVWGGRGPITVSCTMSTEDEILARVRAIPRGRVTAYGDLSPGAPRRAGAVLAASHDPELPWQRVVRTDGSLAKGARQRRLLESEGVPFVGDRVDMRAAWIEPARSPAPSEGA